MKNDAEATPKSVMRVMGVKGLTLYHLKSHLQKFRLGKQLHRDTNIHEANKDGPRGTLFFMSTLENCMPIFCFNPTSIWVGQSAGCGLL
jgi:hypothetical protein